MGKTIVIKGADFSANGIGTETYNEASLVQGYLVANPENAQFGLITTSGSSSYIQKMLMGKLFVPANSRVIFFIQENSLIIKPLYIEVITSTQNISLTNGSTIPNAQSFVFPKTNQNQGSDGKIVLENNTNNDMYYYINFTPTVDLSSNFPLGNKKCMYRTE